jgi:hypothetical protein
MNPPPKHLIMTSLKPLLVASLIAAPLRPLIATILLLTIAACSQAQPQQEQYALLMGIDHYAPPPDYKPSTTVGRLDFPDLNGCRNDVSAIYSIISTRYHFKQQNIDTLLDMAATHTAMLKAMNDLLARCKKGDIAFIFYSGHGSQVYNSLSADKPDKWDETIVPCDTWREGVADIRDKELSAIFNHFIDKGIKLTVIFDCCHSGSISRGPNLVPGRARFIAAANGDAKDPVVLPFPERRPGDNFMIFSASQAGKPAIEVEEMADSAVHIYHGAFTLALMEALRQEPADIPAQTLFTITRAIIKNDGADQEPVIGGQSARVQETLFGKPKDKMQDEMLIPVTQVSNGAVSLGAGWALGLYRENELVALGPDKKDTLFVLRVEKVTGIGSAEAYVTKGNISDIRPGLLFKVTNWASPDLPLITVYMPPSTYSNADITRIAAVAAELKSTAGTRWLEQLKGANPYLSVFFDRGKCFLKVDTAAAIELPTVTAQNILAHWKKDSTLYMELPLSQDSAAAFKTFLSANHTIQLVDSPAAAQYSLYGKLGLHGQPAYGFRRLATRAADSLESMPLATDCFEFKPGRGIQDSLASLLQRLSKLHAWLNMIVTPVGNRHTFPFHLAIYNEDRKMMLTDHYHVGDNISFSIIADSDYMHYQAMVKNKYVYVFAVDQSGSMQLLYPGSLGNSGNTWPQYDRTRLVDTVPLGLTYPVPAPSGTDNYFLLATDVAIENPDLIFNQDGVSSDVVSRSATSKKGGYNPLSQLLDIGNTGNTPGRQGRGIPAKLPGNWVLKKYAFLCTY